MKQRIKNLDTFINEANNLEKAVRHLVSEIPQFRWLLSPLAGNIMIKTDEELYKAVKGYDPNLYNELSQKFKLTKF